MSVSRRQALIFGGLGLVGAGLVTVPITGVTAKSASKLNDRDMPRPYRTPLTLPPQLPYTTIIGADGLPVRRYTLTQKLGTAQILPRLTTPILGYNGIFPGPTLRIERGIRAVVHMRNQLPARHPSLGHAMPTSTHLHGSASLPQFDGYANDLTMPGFYKDYQYPNYQPARTLWYHDHSVHFTAQNVYSGLAGQYLISDPEERALLPQGNFDVPLIISDAMFAADGSLGFDDRDRSGLWGDVILVNGKPWPVMKVQRRVYRFRVLNASISRSYRFTLSTGDPVTVVATDAGLIPVAQTIGSWRHASAERYEILIDFRNYAPGKRIELRNLSNNNNRDFDNTGKIMAFDVVADPVDTADPTWNRIPTALARSHPMDLTAAAATKTRSFRIKHDDVTNIWTINDMTWEEVIASGFRKAMANPALNAVEIWEFRNTSGGWHHPMHMHLVDFQILSRNGKPPFPYEKGPKDVVYVGERETVRVLVHFGPNKGRYMLHCHNLTHEDHSMMLQFRVGLGENDADPNDPIGAAPAVWDTEQD